MQKPVRKAVFPVAGFFRRQPWTDTCAGVGAILGHNHSLFLRFRGGRGVLTATGAMLAINPLPLIPAALCAYLPIKLTRYISLGSMTGAVCNVPFHLVLVLSKRDSWPHLAYSVASASLIVAEHYDNIQRLLSGTERKLGEKIALPAAPPQTRASSDKLSLLAQAR
jgi:glycerol-3-phosphate acyltransferase PlsY